MADVRTSPPGLANCVSKLHLLSQTQNTVNTRGAKWEVKVIFTLKGLPDVQSLQQPIYLPNTAVSQGNLGKILILLPYWVAFQAQCTYLISDQVTL
jgi:hypothetical protein